MTRATRAVRRSRADAADGLLRRAERRDPVFRRPERTDDDARIRSGSESRTADDVVGLHRRHGNQGVQQFAGAVRSELSVSDPDDPYEREAERIAASVTAGREGGDETRQGGRAAVSATSGSDRRSSEPGPVPDLPEPLRGVLGRGRPLSPSVRSTFEPRFGVDLGDVRVHDDSRAAAAATALDARAFTVGRHVAFQRGAFDPGSRTGQALLAHELAHAVQQREGAAAGQSTGAVAATGPPEVQRQPAGVSVRSPVAEEALTQVSTVAGAVAGRPLSRVERDVAASVFGGSVDLSRVRIVAGPVEWRTVGNTIYVPEDFSIADSAMRQTFVHEMTHVWQYQHRGTAYISESIAAQLVPILAGKSRNLAYDYSLTPGKSFFEYNPEQQGLIVENYFAMLRDQQRLAGSGGAAGGTFTSNHMTASGEWQSLTAAERQREIANELPWHRERIAELRSAAPRSELQLLEQRAQEVMRVPGLMGEGIPEERQLTPVKPILEVRF